MQQYPIRAWVGCGGHGKGDHAFQGNDALKMVEEAETSENPYALIFVDVRMPPGWDGIETIRRIWEKFPNNEITL